MRLKTSSAMREVDKWKEVVSSRYRRFVTSLSFLLVSIAAGRLLFSILIVVGLIVNFAFLQLASLIVLGALLLRLHSYRFANQILRTMS